MAVFGSPLEVKEIKDSWDDILATCADGTYKQKYKIGNYKPLDLGAEGIINMQIAGREVDALADGSGMAPLSWVGIELLKTSKRLNPDRVSEYLYPDSPSWVVGTGSNADLWTTQTAYCQNSVARATWIITAEESGTVTVAYSTSSSASSYNKLSVKVNGEAVATDFAGITYIEHPVEVQAGDTVTVEAEYTVLSSSTNTSYTGRVRLTSTGQITVAAEIEDAPKRVFSHYREGTGPIGGWEKSELRVYYNDALLPLISENVRTGLKTVLKNQPACNKVGNSYAQTTEEKVCPPSYTELYASASSTNQPRYKALFPDNASRVKKKASAVSWRLRSAYSNYGFYGVQSSGSSNFSASNVSSVLALPLCFFT